MARPLPTPQPRVVTLFRSNGTQAVRIPAEFAFPRDQVRISRDGDRLVLEPVGKKDLLAALATLDPIEEDLSRFRRQAAAVGR